jgi:adenylosuccinate lyase
MNSEERTKPKCRFPQEVKPDRSLLAHGRYGTDDTIEIWGPVKTFQKNLDAQAVSVETLSHSYPGIVPPYHSEELVRNAKVGPGFIDPLRIEELEEKLHHDVAATNAAWGEKVSKEAAAHINKARTSADTTETAKALQIKRSIEVLVDSLENLRDITLERMIEWKAPNIDTTHLLDALPSLAGRPFAFYTEALQTGINLLAYFYSNSIRGKWADATGNHHSAVTLGIDGIKLQEEYCKKLGIGHMIAPAQIPAREFLSDIVYGVFRNAATMANTARYVRWGRSSDVGIFKFPRGSKGSSAMPHKDLAGGNPRIEEQTESFFNYMLGALSTSGSSTQFDYARDLTGSASDRIMFDDMFKWGDHVTRELGGLLYKLELNPERCLERIGRSYGVVTSEQLMTYLTDHRRTSNPMARDEAHDLAAKLATEAYDRKRNFTDVVLASPEVTSRLSRETIVDITDPIKYLGQTEEIMDMVFKKYHGKRTLLNIDL